MFPNPDKLYARSMHPEDAETLDLMTQPKSWDYHKFSEVMVALGIVGEGNFIPARNAPESVHLQGWREFINDLQNKTRTTGKEYARTILSDFERKKLVMGKITSGTEGSVMIDVSKQPGREKFQRRIATLHTHPLELTAHGLSDQDYRAFLSDAEQQAMLIAYGEGCLIMIMKTSVTSANLSRNTLEKIIKDCEADFLRRESSSIFESMIEFNREMCIELGLTMYMATKESRDLFERVKLI